MLKPFLLVPAVIVLVFAAEPTLGHMPQQNPVKPTADSQAKAKKLYSIECAMCHGDSGDGKTDLATSMQLTMTDLTDPKTLASKTDQDLFTLIRKGSTQGDKMLMPPEDPARAKDDDIWNLIIYIRNFSKGHPAAPGN